MDKQKIVFVAMEHGSGRGTITDNALNAIVTSPLFRTRTEKAKKVKGPITVRHKSATGIGTGAIPLLIFYM